MQQWQNLVEARDPHHGGARRLPGERTKFIGSRHIGRCDQVTVARIGSSTHAFSGSTTIGYIPYRRPPE